MLVMEWLDYQQSNTMLFNAAETHCTPASPSTYHLIGQQDCDSVTTWRQR